MNITKAGVVIAKVVGGVQDGAIAVGTGTGEAGKTFWAGFKAERARRAYTRGIKVLSAPKPKYEGAEGYPKLAS